MIRTLAFVGVRVLELFMATLYPLAPSLCVGITWLLDPLHERLAPVDPLQLDDYQAVLRSES